jgi:hypothetical protein
VLLTDKRKGKHLSIKKQGKETETGPTRAHVDGGHSHVTATPPDPGAVPMSQSQSSQTQPLVVVESPFVLPASPLSASMAYHAVI